MRLKLPRIEVFDQTLGLRSWGLIIYGALPACLSLLGFLEIKVALNDKPGPILLVSFLPLFVTFLLVRAREREWYLTNNHLNLRSAITTILIVLCATSISGAAGIIRQKYVFSLANLTDRGHMMAMTESFLFGIASLVISSTLFATVLTKGAELPGLPSSAFVSAIAKIRQQLIAIQNSTVWAQFNDAANTQILDDLNSEGAKLMTDLQLALSQPGHKLAKRSLGLNSLQSDIVVFTQSIAYIKDGEIPDTILFRWQTYFADFKSLVGPTLDQVKNERDKAEIKAAFAVLQKMKGLRLGG